jgi:hypothetical protein
LRSYDVDARSHSYPRPDFFNTLRIAAVRFVTVVSDRPSSRQISSLLLKKAGMTRLADDGATSHQLMAVSGHRTLKMVEIYTRGTNERKLADEVMSKKRTLARKKLQTG